MLEYARWKYWLVAIVLLVSLIFALPNVFGDEQALQIARKDRAAMDAAQLAHVEDVLKKHGVVFKSAALEKGSAIVRFDTDTEQLKARDVAKDESAGLAKDYVNAMMYASRSPAWLQMLGLRAMPLGLDLRGGLYLLYQVDVDGAVAKLLDSYDQDIRRALRTDNLTFTDINTLTAEIGR